MINDIYFTKKMQTEYYLVWLDLERALVVDRVDDDDSVGHGQKMFGELVLHREPGNVDSSSGHSRGRLTF